MIVMTKSRSNLFQCSKIIPLLMFVLCAFLVFGCSKPKDYFWGVYFSGLPERIFAELAGEDAVFYILKQTHEPILRRDDGENYSSRILKNWRRSVDSSIYTFCPDTSQRFNTQYAFSTEYLKTHIAFITRRYSPDFAVSQTGGCVVVDFKKSRKGYLEFLTKYTNAPTIRENGNIEAGLGAFYVADISKEKIVLKRKKYCGKGYNTITVYEYGGISDLNPQKIDLKDFNRIPESEIPENVSKQFLSFENISLKSVSLVINSPNIKLRKIVYNCVDIVKLRQAFFPKTKGFYDIATILPVGVPGGQAGRPMQLCSKPHQMEGTTLIFANWRSDNQRQLETFATDFHKTTGIIMKIKNYSAYDLVKTLFKRPHPYNLVMIGNSLVQPEYDVFFKDFLKKDGLLDFDLPHLNSLRNSMIKEEDDHEKTNIAVKIAEGLSSEAAVLPLYQETRSFYYPTEIKNLTVGKNFIEYPDVGDLRW
ncbi:MAG TPA: hypothetical protein DCL44_04690 [Elusimicrobia bacterium]|nr:hypothetical protein [Elusimicrobiota bacterium]